MTKPYGRIYKNKTNISIDARDLYNVWPVGSIYISVVNINPSEYFGGTWEVFGTGRCLVGVDTSQSEFNSVGKAGGSKHLQSHYHSVNIYTNYQGGHYHDGVYWGGGTPFTYTGVGGSDGTLDLAGAGVYRQNYNYGSTTHLTTGSAGSHRHLVSGITGSDGIGDSGNLQPYITVYMWKRIN